MSKLPQIFTGSRICIICEGDEEYEYLEKLISLDVWSKEYCFQLENAEGNGNIPARYQDKYQNSSSDLVLVFCDTDKKPYEQYVDIKRKINEFHGVENAADQIVIHVPCRLLSSTGMTWYLVPIKRRKTPRLSLILQVLKDTKGEQISGRNYFPGSQKRIIRKCGSGLKNCHLMIQSREAQILADL